MFTYLCCIMIWCGRWYLKYCFSRSLIKILRFERILNYNDFKLSKNIRYRTGIESFDLPKSLICFSSSVYVFTHFFILSNVTWTSESVEDGWNTTRVWWFESIIKLCRTNSKFLRGKSRGGRWALKYTNCYLPFQWITTKRTVKWR